MDHPEKYLYLIPALPFLGFLVNGILGKRLGPRAVSIVGCVAPLLAFAVSVQLFLTLRDPATGDQFRQLLWHWIEVTVRGGDGSPTLQANFAFLFDGLSGIMCLVVTGVGSLIHLYSTGYMKGDPGYWRFFAYLNLFTTFMLILVLADNLLLLFIGWEGVGLCSYLLIGFWYQERANAAAGMKAFVVNRIGDFGVLLGMFLLLLCFGTLDLLSINQAAETLDPSKPLLGWGAAGVLTTITLLLFLGCTGKSAQIPLYTWLPDAMAGPTPVSALIHAATMVTSGVYLCCRLNPLFHQSATLMTDPWLNSGNWIMGIGAATALLAGLIAISQNDIKKVLAYSTVSQLGYMFFAVGCGAYSAAFFHVVTHAFFKALLFLGSGAVIMAMHHEQDMRKMGGLRKQLPWTHAMFFIGAAALAGVPGLSGFVSKDEILLLGFDHSKIFWFITWVTAGLTAVYMMRCMAMTFWGESRVDAKVASHVREPTGWVPWVLGILAVLSLVGGFFNWPEALFHPSWADAVKHVTGLPNMFMDPEHKSLWVSLFLSIAMATTGLVLGWVLFSGAGRAWQKRFVEESSFGRRAASLSRNLFHVDEIYDLLIVRPFHAISEFLFWLVDRRMIDGLMVHGPAAVTRYFGHVMSRIQSGFAPQYVAIYSIGAFLLLVIVLLKLKGG